MSKTFLQESSEAFLNLKKSALRRTKENFTSMLYQSSVRSTSKKTWFYLASQKRNFLALSHLFWISLWVS